MSIVLLWLQCLVWKTEAILFQQRYFTWKTFLGSFEFLFTLCRKPYQYLNCKNKMEHYLNFKKIRETRLDVVRIWIHFLCMELLVIYFQWTVLNYTLITSVFFYFSFWQRFLYEAAPLCPSFTECWNAIIIFSKINYISQIFSLLFIKIWKYGKSLPWKRVFIKYFYLATRRIFTCVLKLLFNENSVNLLLWSAYGLEWKIRSLATI